MRRWRIHERPRRGARLALLFCAGLLFAPPGAAAGTVGKTLGATSDPAEPVGSVAARAARGNSAVPTGGVASVAAGGTARGDSLRIYRLGEIIVTADRFSRERHTSTAAFSVTDIEQLPARTVAELIKGTAGVGISTGQKDEAGITMRGFGSRRVAILLDGRPMNLPYYGTFDLSSVSTDDLDGVVVERGPTSVTYGANVMGGVVNLITARGKDRPGTRLRVRTGNHDTGEVHLTQGWVRHGWDLYLSGRAAGSDGIVLPAGFRPISGSGFETGGLRDNSDTGEWDLFGKLGYTRDPQVDLALSLGYHTQEKGVPGAVDEERYWRFTDWRRYFADLTMRRRLSPATQLNAKGYGDIFVNTLVDYEDATYNPSAVFYESTHDTWDTGGIVALERTWTPTHHATYGFSVREDQIKKRMNPTEAWLFHHQVTGSVYAQHVAQIHPRLSGSLGLADDFMVYNHLRTVDHVVGYSAGLTTPLRTGWRLCASVGQSSRFPTLSQLWGSDSGNRHLRAEVARRYELGVDGQIAGGLRTDGTIFWNGLTDLIDRNVRRAGRYENICSARTWGAEAGCAIRSLDQVDLQLSYTYTRSENRESGQPLDLVPRHKVDGRLVVATPGGDTQWALTVTHAGSRFDGEALTAHQTLPAHTTADCRVTTRVARFLTLSLDIQNIGDYSYEEEVRYPAPGRSVLFSASFDF
jgi:outer membrane cobalamin receptor